MHFQLLRVYYKAAVIVPFYTACFFVLFSLLPVFMRHGISFAALEESEFAQLLLKDVFYSGVIGVLTLTAFFNRYKKVAYHPVWRVLTWMLLPYGFIVYLLVFEIDWDAMQRPGKDDMAGMAVMIILCFLHVIGIIISFIDFRATALNFKKEDERLNKETVQLMTQMERKTLSD
jgi:hypothetical protein